MGSIIFNRNLRFNPRELAIEHWTLNIAHSLLPSKVSKKKDDGMEYIVWWCAVGGHSSGVCVSLAGGSIAVSWFFGDFFIKKKVTGRNRQKTLWRVNLEDKGHAWILFSLPFHIAGTEFWIPNLILAPALDWILYLIPGVPLPIFDPDEVSYFQSEFEN